MDTRPGIDPFVWRLGTVTVLGSVMSVLDTTIVNVALDPLARALHADLPSIAWVITSYLLAIAAVTPVAGWAARRHGMRKVYLVSLLLFTLGSLACGLAWSTESLVIARVLQGAGGGLLMPVGQMLIVRAAGRENLGRVMGILAVPTVLAPVVGPTLGGFLLETVSWRAIFLINLPIGALALYLGLRILPRDAGHPTYHLDLIGLALAPIGLTLLTYGLTETATQPSVLRAGVVLPVAAGLLMLAAFVWHARRIEHPLLDLRLFGNRTYSMASLASFANGAISLGGLIILPLYLQSARGEDAITTGLLVAPTAVGVVLVMRNAGALCDRYGGGRLALCGTLVQAVGTVPLLWLDADTSYTVIVVAIFVRGLGVGFVGMPLMTAALVSISHEGMSKSQDASAQLNVLQRVGGSLGTAVFIVILQRESRAGAGASAFGDTFGWVLALTLLSLVPSWFLMKLETQRRTAPPLPAEMTPL
ncbi:MAG: family efflux transporter permease subunit [Frankiales bacterium]|nr:family efflux transporter permease subunit [Frankiales bacterium]